MAGLTKERKKRIEAALNSLLTKAKQHREFIDHDDTMREIQRIGSYRWMLVDVCFDKTGSEIFVNPHRFDGDYDWPELVGYDILKKMIEDSAREHRLRFTSRFKPAILPSEKGWVQLGFRIG